MSFGALSFLSPWPLLGLLALPIIWWLLRTTPPSPQRLLFPPTKILRDLLQTEKSPAHSPWWLTLLRLVVAALVILAISRPVLNHNAELMAKDASGPLILMVDNGWRAADHWQQRREMMLRLTDEAQSNDQLVYIVPTAALSPSGEINPLRPDESVAKIEQMQPSPLNGSRADALTRLVAALDKNYTGNLPVNGHLFWLSDGISQGDDSDVSSQLAAIAQRGTKLHIINPEVESLPIGISARLGKGGSLYGVLDAVPQNAVRRGEVQALSEGGDILGNMNYELKAGARQTEVKIDLPLELRNQIAQLKIKGVQSAGAAHLMDQRSHWRRVGLLSNERGVLAQPLLSPLYYINRALEPYAEIVNINKPDMEQIIAEYTERNVSVIVMSDIGRLIGAPLLRLSEWVEAGGVLVRFAGPHMEKAQDSLIPTPLRQGGRRLGGALSWSKPQRMQAFDENSPFAGLDITDDVVIRRQLLADPARLADKVFIWARLQDGTPLVTARQEVNGWVVLVHVTANSDWSSLPLSGLFVDMLRRLTQLSIAPVASTTKTDTGNKTVKDGEDVVAENSQPSTLLAPQSVMDGFGTLRKPGAQVEPVAYNKLRGLSISSKHPPGFYGPKGQSVALNLFPLKTEMNPLNAETFNATRLSYLSDEAKKLRAPFFLTALLLLMIDSFIVIWMRGGLSLNRPGAAPAGVFTGALVGTLALCLIISGQAFAQDNAAPPPEMKAAMNTHLAYVVTGQPEVDQISKAGLKGLSYVLNRRTAVEPMEPLGVNVTRDELAFYPVLYWPVGPYTQPISEKVAQRVNAYMKHGGMIIFDTKDQDSRVGGLTGTGQKALQTLLSKLDIPRLEPVPKGHVLTKSFYLLSRFPGKYQGGDLWVEATAKRARADTEASDIDGVSTLLITSNDLASAWAIDEAFRPMAPVVPGGQLQREMAFRVGVNIVMYALAGNYKADQVHVPALLERLGQ